MKKLADPIRRVGLIGNTEKSLCRSAVRTAVRLLERSGRRVFSDAETARFAGLNVTVCPNAAVLTRSVDLLVVFGGDGTMLRVARDVGGSRTPILGINIGGLGFLTAVSSADVARALKRVWKGEFHLESRALIEASGRCQNRSLKECALNDFVVTRGNISRLIEVEVAVDRQLLTRYRCDGLIVSSPTGSTAYSLSAGGAVVSPTAEVFTITPICPHTLSNRSVIVSLDSKIEVRVISPRPETILSGDGQFVSELDAGDVIAIRRSRRTVRLMHLAGSSFFETLRLKLDWSGTHV